MYNKEDLIEYCTEIYNRHNGSPDSIRRGKQNIHTSVDDVNYEGMNIDNTHIIVNIKYKIVKYGNGKGRTVEYDSGDYYINYDEFNDFIINKRKDKINKIKCLMKKY